MKLITLIAIVTREAMATSWLNDFRCDSWECDPFPCNPCYVVQTAAPELPLTTGASREEADAAALAAQEVMIAANIATAEADALLTAMMAVPGANVPFLMAEMQQIDNTNAALNVLEASTLNGLENPTDPTTDGATVDKGKETLEVGEALSGEIGTAVAQAGVLLGPGNPACINTKIGDCNLARIAIKGQEQILLSYMKYIARNYAHHNDRYRFVDLGESGGRPMALELLRAANLEAAIPLAEALKPYFVVKWGFAFSKEYKLFVDAITQARALLETVPTECEGLTPEQFAAFPQPITLN